MQHNSAPVLHLYSIAVFFTVGIADLVHNVVHSAVDIEAHMLSATGGQLITDLVQVKLKNLKHFIWILDNTPLPESLSIDLKMEHWIVTLQRCRHVQESGVDRGFNEL